MTIPEFVREKNLGLTSRSILNMIKKDENHYKDAVLIIQNNVRKTYRVLDADLLYKRIMEK